ncbi:hypothetical protein OV450_3420 [Actinobacteria bacterium OV450]|nr:hypothetical protein OV450_3420 [Actinobacteria bacterium OV450]
MALDASLTISSSLSGNTIPVTVNSPGLNNHFTVFSSSSRTGSPDDQELELPRGARTGLFIVDITAATGSPLVVFRVRGVDRTSGKAYTLLTSSLITATGTTLLRVNSGLAAGTNTAKDTLPPVIRISAAHDNSDPITYSVSGFVTG